MGLVVFFVVYFLDPGPLLTDFLLLLRLARFKVLFALSSMGCCIFQSCSYFMKFKALRLCVFQHVLLVWPLPNSCERRYCHDSGV